MSQEDKTTALICCTTFDDFAAKVRLVKWGVPRIFRGQRDPSWPLSSLWERLLKFYRDGFSLPGQKPYGGEHPERDLDRLFGPEGRINRNRFRDALLKQFRDSIRGLPGVSNDDLCDDRKVWALGRHVGLVTPLLDWTRSPHIAAFFACFDYTEFHNPGFKAGLRGAGGSINFMGTEKKSADPIIIWELALAPNMEVEGEFESFECNFTQPHRQKAQQSIFTFLTHHQYIDLESYLVSRDLQSYLTRYEIPGEEVGRVLWNLKLMNITYGSLFPDVEGAAIEANTASALGVLMWQYW